MITADATYCVVLREWDGRTVVLRRYNLKADAQAQLSDGWVSRSTAPEVGWMEEVGYLGKDCGGPVKLH